MSDVSESRESNADVRVETVQTDVSLQELTVAFSRVAAASFGGPVGQIAVMHRIVVEEKKWIDEERFQLALSYCMLLPGPEAQQLATYLGWMLHKTCGGLIAGGLFILPGFIAMLLASLLYVYWRDAWVVEGILYGLRPAMIAIVLQAGFRLANRSLTSSKARVVAVASLIAMFVFGIPFPVVIIAGAILGASLFPRSSVSPVSNSVPTREPGTWSRSLKIITIGGLLWIGPIALIGAMLGPQSVWVQEGWLFGKLAIVSFGGAYSVLAYVQQQAVDEYQWLTASEMIDGLSLGESTPGPLVMVVQFVGFLGAFRNPGSLSPLSAGMLGAIITTWVTFVPCFVWIFLGAPHVEQLQRQPRLKAMLSGITAVVVGVMANLSLHFLVHTWFSTVGKSESTWLGLPIPDFSSVDFAAMVVTAISLVLVFVGRAKLGVTLLVGSVLGILCVAARSLLAAS